MAADGPVVDVNDVAEEGREATLTDKAYKQIEELIVTLRFAPGAVLSEAALAKELGIGRTPIREALQRLAREGLVVILPRRGVLVSEINVKTQLRLIEVRRVIERLIAHGAAERASDAERIEFQAIADGMEEAARSNDELLFMRLDRRFNILEAKAARNEFAARSIGLMHGLARRFWYMHYKEVADMPLAARLHADVARAIAEKSPDKAAAASDRLIDYVEDCTRAALDAKSVG